MADEADKEPKPRISKSHSISESSKKLKKSEVVPSSPPPIQDFEVYKLRTRLVKLLKAEDVDTVIPQLEKVGIVTEGDLKGLRPSIIDQLKVRPKVRAILKEQIQVFQDESFNLKDLLAESKLFQKDNDIQTLAYTSGIAQTLRDKLGLNAWREFFCVTMDDLEQCGLAASEKSSIMSLVTFGGDINKRIVRAQVDQFRKTLNEAMDMYSNIVDTISRAQQFQSAGVPIPIYQDEITGLKNTLYQIRLDASSYMEGLDPDQEEKIDEIEGPEATKLSPAKLADTWKIEKEAPNTTFRLQLRSLALRDSQYQALYRRYFHGKFDQFTLVGERPDPHSDDGSPEPIVVSVERVKKDNKSVSQVLVRRQQGDEYATITGSSKASDALDELKRIIMAPYYDEYEWRKVKENNDELMDKLLRFEDSLHFNKYKFGVLYVKSGQTSESEIFSNDSGSKEYDDFLLLLGEKVHLKGWKKFNAGLDVKENRTGPTSIFTEYENNEIMFHVGTMMLSGKDSEDYRLEKKRHIGNDIACVVFVDNGHTFDPSSMKSEFIHVYIVVTPVQRERKTYYRVQVLSRDAVAPWGPQMPSTLFTASKYTRMFLLTKLINAERTSQDVTIFRNRIVRTRRNMLLDIIQEAKTKHKATMMKKSKRSGLTKSTSKRKLDPKSLRGAFGIMDEKKSKDDSALPGSLSARGDKSSTPSPTLNLDAHEGRERERKKDDTPTKERPLAEPRHLSGSLDLKKERHQSERNVRQLDDSIERSSNTPPLSERGDSSDATTGPFALDGDDRPKAKKRKSARRMQPAVSSPEPDRDREKDKDREKAER